MISVDGFRTAFPEFADPEKYPDARIQFWLTLAQKMCDPSKWYDFYEEGAYLFAAHNLYLERERRLAGSAGGIGPVSSISKSVGDVSKSVSMSTGHYDDAGQWAATVYGQQYWDLMQMIGTGAIQL